jgi:hypothetical protein
MTCNGSVRSAPASSKPSSTTTTSASKSAAESSPGSPTFAASAIPAAAEATAAEATAAIASSPAAAAESAAGPAAKHRVDARGSALGRWRPVFIVSALESTLGLKTAEVDGIHAVATGVELAKLAHHLYEE